MSANVLPSPIVLDTKRDARRAWQSVTRLGYLRDRRSRAGETDAAERVAAEHRRSTVLGHQAAEGAGVGGAIGGALGAIAAALAAVGTTIALPGLGLVIAGPLAAAVAGAGVGAATGGILGALIGWGVPVERVRRDVPTGDPADDAFANA